MMLKIKVSPFCPACYQVLDKITSLLNDSLSSWAKTNHGEICLQFTSAKHYNVRYSKLGVSRFMRKSKIGHVSACNSRTWISLVKLAYLMTPPTKRVKIQNMSGSIWSFIARFLSLWPYQGWIECVRMTFRIRGVKWPQ